MFRRGVRLTRRGLGGKLGQKLREALQLDPESPTAELQKARRHRRRVHRGEGGEVEPVEAGRFVVLRWC